MRRGLCALVVCVAAFASGWANAEPRVAILPVVVHSGAQDPSYLAEGLSDMLAARLEQLGGMRVLRDEDRRSATARLDKAVERGRALSADYVVFGSFTQFGEGASLDLQCAPVHGQDPAAARTLFLQSGAIGEIIPRLDDLADKVAFYVLGDAAAKSAVTDRNIRAVPIRDLLGRVEALERAVYGKAPAPAPAPQAAQPEAAPKAEEPAEPPADVGAEESAPE